jgi:hypothetical protein
MHGSDSISDPVARRIGYTGSCPSARSSAPIRLGVARLAADDVAGGSHVVDVSADRSMTWLMTWHAYCTCWRHHYIRLMSSWSCYCTWWCHNYIMLMSSLACLLFMLTSLLRHADVILSGPVTWVGSTGIRVGSTHPGEEDAWGASARVGRRPAGEWWRVRPWPTSDFDAVFTNGFVSASSTQWYGQNTIFD